MSSGNRNKARDRRLERRQSRKHFRRSEGHSNDVHTAFLDGLQMGMEIQEQHQQAMAELPYQDIFGNIVSPKPKNPASVESDDRLEELDERPLVLH